MSSNDTYRNVRLDKEKLAFHAECRNAKGEYQASSLAIDSVISGFKESTRSIVRLDGLIFSFKLFDNKTWTKNSLDLHKHIQNKNGVLESVDLYAVLIFHEKKPNIIKHTLSDSLKTHKTMKFMAADESNGTILWYAHTGTDAPGTFFRTHNKVTTKSVRDIIAAAEAHIERVDCAFLHAIGGLTETHVHKHPHRTKAVAQKENRFINWHSSSDGSVLSSGYPTAFSHGPVSTFINVVQLPPAEHKVTTVSEHFGDSEEGFGWGHVSADIEGNDGAIPGVSVGGKVSIMHTGSSGSSGLGTVKLDVGTAQLDANAHLLGASAEAGVYLMKTEASCFDASLGVAVDTGFGLVDDSLKAEVAGCGISIGKKCSVSIFGNSIGIDFGRLFG